MLILSPLLELTTQQFVYTYRNLRNVSEALGFGKLILGF